MNNHPKHRIVRVLASLAGSLLVTFTGLLLIANYALPERSPADTVMLAWAGSPAAR